MKRINFIKTLLTGLSALVVAPKVTPKQIPCGDHDGTAYDPCGVLNPFADQGSPQRNAMFASNMKQCLVPPNIGAHIHTGYEGKTTTRAGFTLIEMMIVIVIVGIKEGVLN